MKNLSSKCKEALCGEQVYKNSDFCIFHLPKLTTEEKNNLKPKELESYNKIVVDFKDTFFDRLKELE